jgi:hypothetical protein
MEKDGSLRTGAVPVTKVAQEFDQTPYRLAGMCVWLDAPDRRRPVGTLTTYRDGAKTFLSGRRWAHVLRRPTRSWALEISLLEWLRQQDVAWVRIEVHEERRRPVGFVAALDWFDTEPAIAVRFPPHGEQKALPLDQWLTDDPDALKRLEEFGLFGRSLAPRRKPA